MAEPIPLSEIQRLYNREKWSVARIARHCGVTRQAIYERMWKASIIPDGKSRDKLPLDRYLLVDLYVKQELTVKQVAAQTNSLASKVTRDLAIHGLQKGRQWQRKLKYQPLPAMKVGESIEVRHANNNKEPHTHFLYKQAKARNIRIAIRDEGDGLLIVTRLPIVSASKIKDLRAAGLTLNAIGKLMGLTRTTVSKYLRKYQSDTD
jgi:DNA-binding XRE family transcriptional regulator